MATAGRDFAARGLAAAGALLAGAAVALGAYAAHGADGEAQVRLGLAALFAFGHGLALAALAGQTPHRFGRLALAAMMVGTLLFSGSLVLAAFFGTPTRLAPTGGSLLILAWLAWGLATLRR